jgi:triacylglycerol esterase/lipase EstA (alpha/beta hydrolase family)
MPRVPRRARTSILALVAGFGLAALPAVPSATAATPAASATSTAPTASGAADHAPSRATAARAATDRPHAATDTPGPALPESRAVLADALKCTGDPTKGPTPVLLVPGTGVRPEENFSWNWTPALTKLGIASCTIELPQRTLGDIQTAGEYVVSAIRTLHARAGRRISIMGHSQGGMVFRWALRFWPDTRPMVDDAIGFAGSNHGTTLIDVLPTCALLGCPAASLQQGAGSQFITALNSRQETFAGVSYTNIRSKLDEVVLPSNTADPKDASSSLTTGDGRITNVAIQDVCPGDLSEHLLVGTTSNTAYALAIDALTHDGPADPARVAPSTCASPLMPGVDPLNLAANLKLLEGLPGLASVIGVNLAGVPVMKEEPALKDYVYAQPAAPAPTAKPDRGRLRITPGRIRAGRTTKLTIRTTTSDGTAPARQRVSVLGRTVRTSSKGRATLRVHPRTAGLVTARATGAGLPTATARIRVLRAR